MTTILHIIESVHPYGGTPNKLLMLCRKLDRSKYKVVLVFHGKRDQLRKDFEEAGVKVVQLKPPFNKGMLMVLLLVRIILAYRIDLINTHFNKANILGTIAGMLTFTPVIQNEHGIPRGGENKKPFARMLVSVTDNYLSIFRSAFICNSHTVRSAVKRSIRYKHDKMYVVQNAIDCGSFLARYDQAEADLLRLKFNISKNAVVFGSIGGFIKMRDFITPIKAFEIVLKEFPDSAFIIAGDGPNFEDTLNYVKSRGLDKKVFMIRYSRDVPELLKSIDIYIDCVLIASGAGLALLEPMLAEKPVIGFMEGEKEDFAIMHNLTGFIVEPRSPAALSEKMLTLARSSRLREDMGKMARARVLEGYNSERFAENICSIYNEISGIK